MKFSKNGAKKKEISNALVVDEYCAHVPNLPIDGAVAYLDGSFGPKTNVNFTELLFVLKGKIVIQFDKNVYELYEEDMFIIPPNKKHSLNGSNAKIFIACAPGFRPENLLMERDEK